MQRVLRGLGSFQAVNLKGFSGEQSWPTWRQMTSAAYEHLEALWLSADTKNVALTVSIWGLWDVLVLSKSDICLADWMSGLRKRFLLPLTVFLILIKCVQKYWADVINNLCFHPEIMQDLIQQEESRTRLTWGEAPSDSCPGNIL